jgi:hypothetical protein
MLERGDVLALHEPFWNLLAFGQVDVGGRTFDAPDSLLAWLRDETRDIKVFVKDTTDHRYERVLADRRFLADARHAFLIRRPEEVAASYYALWLDMRIEEVGLETLHELHAAVRDAGGHPPVVIDSDDLVARPEATMAAYCAAVELPFIPQALTWAPGERPEWRRSARWHSDVAASSGFEQREHTYGNRDRALLGQRRSRVGPRGRDRRSRLQGASSPHADTDDGGKRERLAWSSRPRSSVLACRVPRARAGFEARMSLSGPDEGAQHQPGVRCGSCPAGHRRPVGARPPVEGDCVVADASDRGRDSFGRRAWGDAFAELSVADRESALGLEDLEQLAVAAYMVGADAVSEDACCALIRSACGAGMW